MSHPYTQQKWDVIVVGSGVGGGTVGRALAEAGKKVLFVEFGKSGSRAQVNGLSDTCSTLDRGWLGGRILCGERTRGDSR